MPLYRATALIAVLLMLVLSAGYAVNERDEPGSTASADEPRS
jgi:hypothetical protein